jgi:PAS domain S-box-containing protein
VILMSWEIAGFAAAAVGHLGRTTVAAARPDVVSAYLTLGLSALVALGYAALAFNWYFQIKVAPPEARKALRRLLVISLACAACGAFFYLTDLGWGYFRLYDVGIAGLAAYTWTFVLRMRGLSLVDERLGQLAELERRAESYREIAELLPHLVWTATSEGRVDFSNRRWLEYAGGSHPWTEAVHDDDHERVAQWWAGALGARRAGTVEARLRGAGGAYRTFLVSVTPIVHGDAVKWLGACADIEDQKLLAAEKERQVRQKSFFLNALSHDLRSPLNVLALHAELLRTSVKEGDAAESARMIVENAAAAGELINRLLDFARVGSLERNVTERVPVAAVLRQVQRRFEPIARRNGLSLRVEGETEIEVRTDRHKVERIVSNLVDNGIKYTPSGGVTVAVVRGGEGTVNIEVSDTGIGVPREKADSLFEEFYQVGNDERDRRKGFGLGLAICRALARQIGGEVRLVRTGPEGSCFALTVPLCADDRPPVVEVTVTEAAAGFMAVAPVKSLAV